MFTFEQMIQQIELFAMNPEFISLLEKMKKLDETYKTDKNLQSIENLIGPLRKCVTKLLKEKKDNDQDALLYDILISLTELLPINSECVFTLSPIPSEKKISLSTGHFFDIDKLIEWLQTNEGSVNPFDNSPFSERDLKRVYDRLLIENHLRNSPSINTPPDDSDNTLLLQYITLNDTEMAIQIIDARADVNLANKEGITPLMMAAKLGNDRILHYLILHGAIVNVVAQDNMTAWQFAELYQQKTCRLILENLNAHKIKSKAYIHAKEKLDFFAAIQAGNVSLLKPFLETHPEFFNAFDDHGDHVSVLAVKNRHLACLQYLKMQGTHIDENLLTIALKNEAEDCFDFLLKEFLEPLKRANFEVKGIPLVYFAANYNKLESLKTLIQAGANVNACYQGFSPLFQTTAKNYAECFSILVEAGADIRFKAPPKKISLVYQAIDKGSDDCLELLANYGADFDELSNDNVPPICLATMLGRITSLAILLKGGANQNVSYKGFFPVHFAVGKNHLECLKLLLKAGGDLSKTNVNNETIMDIAKNNPESPCYAFLQTFTSSETLPSIDSYIPTRHHPHPLHSNHRTTGSIQNQVTLSSESPTFLQS